MTHIFPLREPHWHEAHSVAHEVAHPVESESVPITLAVGRVTAADVTSLINLPLDTTSAMDGWAVGDATGPWQVVEDQALAGHLSSGSVAPGTAMLIATGGVVPAGTFGVIRREFAETFDSNSTVFIRAIRDVEPFENSHVRPAGAEATRGDVLVQAGTRLSPAHAALLAMAGHDEVRVARQISCEIFVLGDEVLRSGIPESGQVRDAFEPQFAAYAELLGLQVTGFQFIPDTLEATIDALSGATAQVVITTGGTAAGPKDFLHTALAHIDAELIIDSIAMRPGHPNTLARRADQFIVGLPGNPLSASLGGMLTLARPLAHGLNGMKLPELSSAVALKAIKAPASDSRLVPVQLSTVEGRIQAQELPWLNSGMMRGLANADAVAVVPPGGVSAGHVVQLLELPWTRSR